MVPSSIVRGGCDWRRISDVSGGLVKWLAQGAVATDRMAGLVAGPRVERSGLTGLNLHPAV
ncbi:hypothetical protein GCM10008959_40450 [Deinococcus seoulensis]|uniref:Transposase n=1 Tax=Deinococcus seoulensis TaxID=1837379 RepID=A0ABQ2RY91_9DEIO|nr:hypothetical protein GCM10008959_40450 [Deinococcus seoulensis]